MDQKNKEFDYSNLYKGFQNKSSSARRSGQQSSGTAADGSKKADDSASSRPRDPQQERQLQQELEAQLRALGQSVSDGLREGFEGKGQQLGDQAVKFGGAVWDVVNYSLGTAASELRKAANELRAEHNAAAGEADAARRARRAAFGVPSPKVPAKPADALVRSARARFGIGLGQAIPGGILAFGMLLSCAICALTAFFYAGPDAFAVSEMTLAATILAVTSLPFDWLTWLGLRNVGASKRLRAYAAAIGERSSISVAALAEAVQKPLKKTRKDLRFLLGKGWLTGWLDAETDVLYLSAEEWHAARAKRENAAAGSASQQPAAPQSEYAAEERVDPDTIHRFVQVLGTERQVMDDATAIEELTKMQTTSQAIAEWVAAHPESAPKARRFITYYIPTTLKLLHTYNEMQDQPGENAEAIRRDIGGILHTLNIAFENLYNTLLSDMAMDVSTEIAALQGMLAQDGLSPQQNTPFGGGQ